MAIYLDKHDFFEITPAEIAQIYLKGSGIQKEFGCWVLAYWFDQKRKTTFCLIDAPNLESVKEMHCHLYHSYPRQIFQVEEDLIASFLNCIECPNLNTGRPTSQLLFSEKSMFCAVMVMKLYCCNTFLKKEYTKKWFADFKLSSQRLVKKNNGRIVNCAWEYYIYSFDSIFQAINSALQICQELDVLLKRKGDEACILNIGIAGEKQMNEKSNPCEETHNLARRLCCIASTNQIVISSLANEQIQLHDMSSLIENFNVKSLNFKEEQFLSKLMDYLELNFREDLKIGNFCKIIGESRSQLYRKILEITNLPPLAFINEFRLKRATELMNMKRGNNISQIAFEAGFNNLSYFSRRFKKRFGVVPSTYMNKN